MTWTACSAGSSRRVPRQSRVGRMRRCGQTLRGCRSSASRCGRGHGGLRRSWGRWGASPPPPPPAPGYRLLLPRKQRQRRWRHEPRVAGGLVCAAPVNPLPGVLLSPEEGCERGTCLPSPCCCYYCCYSADFPAASRPVQRRRRSWPSHLLPWVLWCWERVQQCQRLAPSGGGRDWGRRPTRETFPKTRPGDAQLDSATRMRTRMARAAAPARPRRHCRRAAPPR